MIYFSFLKLLNYNSVVLDQDSDKEITGLKPIHVRLWNFVRHGENPSALNPESSTHYDKNAREKFDNEQRQEFEERESMRREMQDEKARDEENEWMQELRQCIFEAERLQQRLAVPVRHAGRL